MADRQRGQIRTENELPVLGDVQAFSIRKIMTPAEFMGAFAAPVLIVPPDPDPKVINMPLTSFVTVRYGTTQYANGGAPWLQYGDTPAAGGAVKCFQFGPNIDHTAINAMTETTLALLFPVLFGVGAAVAALQEGIYFSNETGAFTTGDSAIVVDVFYFKLKL